MEKLNISDLNEKEQRFTRMFTMYKVFVLPAYVFLIGITESVIFFLKMADGGLLKKMSFLFIWKDSEYFVYLLAYLLLIYVTGMLVKKISKNPEKSIFLFFFFAIPPFYVAGFFVIMINFAILCIDDNVMMNTGKIFLLDYIFCKGLVFIIAWQEWNAYGEIIYKSIKDSLASKKQEMSGRGAE